MLPWDAKIHMPWEYHCQRNRWTSGKTNQAPSGTVSRSSSVAQSAKAALQARHARACGRAWIVGMYLVEEQENRVPDLVPVLSRFPAEFVMSETVWT
jgi:hypothetical protein